MIHMCHITYIINLEVLVIILVLFLDPKNTCLPLVFTAIISCPLTSIDLCDLFQIIGFMQLSTNKTDENRCLKSSWKPEKTEVNQNNLV